MAWQRCTAGTVRDIDHKHQHSPMNYLIATADSANKRPHHRRKKLIKLQIKTKEDKNNSLLGTHDISENEFDSNETEIEKKEINKIFHGGGRGMLMY